jgi:hypothetical protein
MAKAVKLLAERFLGDAEIGERWQITGSVLVPVKVKVNLRKF